MGILLGLTAALYWGSADFFTRYATRLVGTYRTLFFMQFFGVVLLSLLVALTGTWHLLLTIGWQTWLWTLIAIALNIVSSLALYRAFEVGVLTIVSPIAASYAAITVLLAVLAGEVISQVHGVGIAASLVGVVLAATPITWKLRAKSRASALQTARTASWTSGISLAIMASLGYGIAFWLFGFRVTPVLGGILPVWLVRLVTSCVLLLFAPVTHQDISIPRGRIWWYLTGVGILDTAAFLAATVGYTTAQVSIVSVLASLFSAVTVLLARLFLHDRLQWNQWFGVGIIFVGVALVNI
ncbi:MAG: DMT family transporter [Ktedonobacteraceae bacterium]